MSSCHSPVAETSNADLKSTSAASPRLPKAWIRRLLSSMRVSLRFNTPTT
ncbi:hypothetical protein Y027_4666 [Burkholderia pseudomallei TSV5]|nr:hypothetical protein X989_4925 [Burkholderia pseudomallei MSHR4378]KGS21026.1 hypothetical protein X962_5538 [Burkholderia pseudomallei MSHR7343]KGS78079.1 hypothetical protein X947_4738 [Burkholderia pseudomallei MSHR7334]KGX53247.1 hypothetical protein Y027_4666 [Burkholderia pseudomallei TSV5]